MNRLLRQIGVIARRDFLAIVATPTFLLFLFAPMLMIGFGAVGGSGAAQLGAATAKTARIVAITAPADAGRLKAADKSLRTLYRQDEGPPELMIIAPKGDAPAQQRALFGSKDYDVSAVLTGPLSAPQIAFKPPSNRHAAYLGALADAVTREGQTGLALDRPVSRATIAPVKAPPVTKRGQQAAGFGAVFVVFFLTLLLAGQAVGTLAEEKSNKVIEILAAAVPLEAVFLGKLIGMFGVAIVFVLFWAALATKGIEFIPAGADFSALAPAIGLPLFLIFGALYFAMAYMLLGAVFLGVGAQASTIREIQMLSLPITIFQVTMFGLSSAAAANPGSALTLFAEIFPFSSPFAMAARGATDPAIWPHLLALGWQALWVGITIWISVRLFRIGVLKSGGGDPRAWFSRRKAAQASV